MDDRLAERIREVIEVAKQPLETKEIEAHVAEKIPDATRVKILYRLNNLRGEGTIRGKFVGPGKGVWIWWKSGVFEK